MIGIVTVFTSEMVVAGIEAGAGGGVMTPAVTALSAGALDAGVATGTGTKVIVLGTLVTIPGLASTCGAQIPAR